MSTAGADVLSPAQREVALSRLRTEEFDVVVVGGGVTGAGAALDAVTRGLRVALVEQRDWASGTSSRSGKLFHGGLRYLEKLDFGLVREALRERALMLRTLCPHLVRPVRFLYPLEHRVWERAYVGAGVLLYDTIGGAGAVPRHRHLTRTQVGRVAPGLRQDTLIGAVSYFDVQVDDARHTVVLVRTAAAHGAVVVSAAKVVGYERDGERVTGVRVLDAEAASQDSESGDAAPFVVHAKAVIHAAGVWTDDLQELLGGQPPFHVTPSKGVHLVVPRDRIRSDAAILVRAEDSVLLIRPWFGHWIIGTTDTPWAGDRSSPAATSADIDYLLRNANRVLDPPLTRDDIDGVYAGLRPLITAAAGATSNLSREHTVATPRPGLSVVAGGKYTTYRVMARDVVDAAAADLKHVLGHPVPPSVTQDVPLLGAAGWRAAHNRRQRIAADTGIGLDNVDLLLRRHGALITQVLDELAGHPELAAQVPGAPGYLLVEARFAATHEGALHLEDVLTRRTHLAVETRDRGLRAADAIAPVLAEALGWDDIRTRDELDAYRARVAAEIASQQLPDDAAADAARLAARDPRVAAAAAARRP